MTVYLGSTATLYPRLKVEIAFQNDPYATSITWTDVTSYVRGEVSCKRGRNYELNKNDAGTASFSLENTDGRFSPLNTSSPYYPYVLPYRPVRVTATDAAGTVYPIFRGFVERWPQQWDQAGNYGTVAITAVDATKTVLARTFGQKYSDYIIAKTPSQNVAYYYSLDGLSGPHYDFGGSSTLNVTNTAGFLTSAYVNTIIGSGSQSLQCTFDPSVVGAGSDRFCFYFAEGVGFEFYFRIDQADSNATHSTLFLRQTVITGTLPNTTEYGLLLRHSTTATSGYEIWTGSYANATNTYSFNAKVCDVPLGQTLHVAIPRPASGSAGDVYINGVLTLAAQTNYTYAGGNSGNPTFGQYKSVYSGAAYPRGLKLTFGHALTGAVNGTVSFDANEVVNHYNKSGVQGNSTSLRYSDFPSQLTSDRVSQTLDSIGWPSAQRSIQTGATTVQASGSLSGKTVLDTLQTAADDELGNVFVDGQGHVVFHNRAKRNGPTSAATFGEGTGEVPYLDGVTVDFDDQYVYNDIAVTMSGSSSVSALRSDTSSQTTYGLRTLSRSTSTATSSDVSGQADTLLARYKQPVARLGTLPVDIKSNPSVIGTVLSREIGELVTVKRRPLGAPVISLDVFVDGIEDRISPTGWTRSLLLTPKFANATY